MQLILNSDTDIGIQRKMSAIEQEPFSEKFINSNLSEKINSGNCDINRDSVNDSVVDILDNNQDIEPNGDINEGDKNTSSETSSDVVRLDEAVSSTGSKCTIDCDQENSNEVSDVITKQKESEENKSDTSEKNEEKQTDLRSIGDVKLNGEQQESRDNEENVDNSNNAVEQASDETHDNTEEHKSAEEQENEKKDNSKENLDKEKNQELTTNTDLQSNIHEVDTSMEDNNDDNTKTQTTITDSKTEVIKEISTDSIGDENIIDIPDDKDGENVTIDDQDVTDVEKQSETLSNMECENLEENAISVKEGDNSCANSISTSKNTSSGSNDDIPKNTDNCLDSEQSKKENLESKLPNKESKKLSLICKLSNTLDILSDEEEEPVKNESQKELCSVEKQCIDIDDDDDIMLVDDETGAKDDNQNADKTKVDDTEYKEDPLVNSVDKEDVKEKEALDDNKDSLNITEKETDNPQEENKTVENKITQKPLLPFNFLKSCKKNLADMTRDELEEFCILKIVESVVDRSNLSEIKAQLKTMGQNIEEYRKKAHVLSKQNRDLQVVLKSVQEEQKKKSDVPITPLKITRSVGMQVFMTDKIAVRRKSTLIGNNNAQNNSTPNNTPNRLNKSQSNQTPKTPKSQSNGNNNQQIPVPRLVPANNANNNRVQSPSTNTAVKSPATVSLPNGIRTSPPTQKPEKRPHSKMQQGNSVTVDLTDDEPPSKIAQRNVNPPVRLVSPQNLLAPQRQPFGSNISSPRKVYIPISGSQNQIRAGQTIMVKPVPPPGPRQKLPPILPKGSTNTNALRMTRINNRHPAPLPDCLSRKQYQPPNWKDLPPSPELKLSKVENGIVISWKIDGYDENRHEEIASYQLYAYQETSSPPSPSLWKKIGDVKALPLPMACTLTQFMAGYKYFFAVRAVDIRSRLGPFSTPGSILLLNKM